MDTETIKAYDYLTVFDSYREILVRTQLCVHSTLSQIFKT